MLWALKWFVLNMSWFLILYTLYCIIKLEILLAFFIIKILFKCIEIYSGIAFRCHAFDLCVIEWIDWQTFAACYVIAISFRFQSTAFLWFHSFFKFVLGFREIRLFLAIHGTYQLILLDVRVYVCRCVQVGVLLFI